VTAHKILSRGREGKAPEQASGRHLTSPAPGRIVGGGEEDMHDVIIVGAGVAGLQCARLLKAAGADVLVVDRSDKPGGRCATRTFGGQPADYGPLFIHGHDARFLAAVEDAAGSQRIPEWPIRRVGRGSPCQPDAYAPHETRLALSDGINAFPKALSAGLPLKLRTQVASIRPAKGTLAVTGVGGERLESRDVVLAMALEQSIPFVDMLKESESREGILALLRLFVSLPCLTVIAGYPKGTKTPDFDLNYPEDDHALMLMSNESSKRLDQGQLVMTFQAAPRWSREHMDAPKEAWARELIATAARRLGPWTASPDWTHIHRWKYSRVDRANELAGPLELKVGQSRIGIAGDLFSPGGGIQAAWLSGGKLAERFARSSAQIGS
jgi:renalase